MLKLKYINSILKTNKKVCSQAYLEECNFINDGYNKMVDKYKIILLIKPSRLFLEHFGFSSLNLVDCF